MTRLVRVRVMLGTFKRLLSAPEIDYAAANAVLRQLFRKVIVRWEMKALDFHWQHGGINRITVRDGSW